MRVLADLLKNQEKFGNLQKNQVSGSGFTEKSSELQAKRTVFRW